MNNTPLIDLAIANGATEFYVNQLLTPKNKCVNMSESQLKAFVDAVKNIQDQSEATHLRWIYHRLINIHKEKENYDYMLKFNEIIKSKEST